MAPTRSLRSLRAAIALLAATFAATCSNLDNFDVEVGGSATIPHATIVDTLLNQVPIDSFQGIDLTNELENQGVTKDDIDSARVSSFVIAATAPSGATLDFLDSVAFYAETDGQPKLLLASLDPVPDGAPSIVLDVNASAELKPYVTAPSMRIISEVKGSKPDVDTTLRADVVLDVDVTLPGCE